jgi:hypothetical protein
MKPHDMAIEGLSYKLQFMNGTLVHSTGLTVIGCSPPSGSDLPMPHKHNADRRHHIPKMAFKVQNWPAYEAGLRRRGSLTLWMCVQRRLACSAGDKPAGVEVRAP